MGGIVSDPAQPLPTTRAEAEQLLLVLESEPYMRDLVSPDRSAALIHLRSDHNSSARLLETAQLAEDWWVAYGPDGATATTTGVMYEFARAEDAIAYGQLAGLTVAAASVAIVLFLALGSARYALIAMLPNLVPVLVMFGAMGYGGVPLDASTVVLSGLALGIAVDDTVHLAIGYLGNRRRGFCRGRSIELAMRRSAGPILFTTVAVSLGFGVLCLSGFVPVAGLGFLTVSVMVLCLFADLTLLPALLLIADVEAPAEEH
jgi:predicted RND superfamily exporter protein